MRQPDPSLTEAGAAVLRDIEEQGVHLVHVEPEEGEGPAYSYTVGLTHTYGHPEVLVIGLSGEVAQELLDVVSDQVAGGLKLEGGRLHDGVVDGYPVVCLPLNGAAIDGYLGVALWAYQNEEFDAVQLVYPDKMGRWPWTEGTQKAFVSNQPVVGERGQGA